MTDWRLIAYTAVDHARRELAETLPELVGTVFWYGAVDIDPKHLIVWVLLTGPAEKLPEWFFPSGDRTQDRAAAKGRLDELYAVMATIRRAFDEAGWPQGLPVAVGFDSEERVEQGGGYAYFK